MLIHREPWKYSGRTPEFFTGQAGCYCCGTAVTGNHHVFFGTKSPGTALATGYKYESAAWSAITSAAVANVAPACGYIENGIAYHAYGSDAAVTTDARKYTSTSDAWSGLTSGPSPARYQAMPFMVVDMFVCGGRDLSTFNPLSDNDSYVPASDSWTGKTNLSAPARYVGHGFSINGYGFVVGGVNAALNNTADNDRYDISADSWSAKTDCSAVRITGGVFVLSGIGYIAYGKKTTGLTIRDLDYYTESTDTWTAGTQGPAPARQWVASSGVSTLDAGYVTTGQDNSANWLKDHEEYTSGAWTSLTDIAGDARQQGAGASC